MAKIETYEMINPRIYAYTTPGINYHEGWIKIGYTATQTVDERIKQQTQTAWIIYNTEWTRLAPFDETTGTQLTDKDFHKFLTDKRNVKRASKDLEWFKIDADTARKYFEEFSAGKTYRTPTKIDAETYTLRKEQTAAITQTLEYCTAAANANEFLWNAKPRFGKNLTVYEFIKEYDAAMVLIVTNRPAIATAWYDDFIKFTAKNPDANYIFATSSAIKIKNVAPFDGTLEDGQRLIAFISLQDLKGAENFGGRKKKLAWINDFEWDILVVDESHEGVDTARTQTAFENITRDFTLYLSGTPFKAIASGKFAANQIFNWSYLDEQAARRNFDAEPNPYADLPRMNLFTYRLSDMILGTVRRGLDLSDDEHVDYTFDLNEFFSTDGKTRFVHEADVKKFLDALTQNEKFPFSTPELRAELKHTFWLLYRVDSAKAMAKLLNEHEVFREYDVILAAGDGKLNEDDANEKSLKKVKDTIKADNKTITLSVGQLTTGVTVPEWSAVLMLSELKSAAAYIQAAFRAQNPHKFTKDNIVRHKTNCYVFDFNPARTLEIYSEFARSLGGSDAPADNARRLLNFFPVLAEDSEGKMVELNADQIVSLPQTIKASHAVDAGFMSNFILNVDKISRVFRATKSVTDIINNMPVDSAPNKKPEPINLNDFKVDENNIDTKTTEIFGQPEHEPPTAKPPKPELTPSDIAQNIANTVKPEYGLTDAQTKRLAAQIDKKIASDTSPENIDRIQREVIAELETKRNEAEKQKAESDIRARLRGFARTIPSFLMAYGDASTTLANFENCCPSEEIFLEVTGITRADFRFLRDGGTRNGETFAGGLFDETIFNNAIQEFLRRKAELADYFSGKNPRDIFDYIPPQRTNQIFTPRAVANQMLDALEAENPAAFDDPNATFFDPYMKSGMFIAGIVRRLFHSPVIRKIFPDENARLRHILENQVYGFAPTEIILRIATEYVFGAHPEISRKNFCRLDTTAAILDGSFDAAFKKKITMRVTVLNHDRIKKFGEVFTPAEIVDFMLDHELAADIFTDLDAKILEPAAGQGAFLLGILRRKIAHAKTPADTLRALASIYGIEIQHDNLAIARAALAAEFAALAPNTDPAAARKILNANIVHGNTLTAKTADGRPIEFPNWDFDGDEISPRIFFRYADLTSSEGLGFDSPIKFIVSNPPYQLDTSGDNKTFAKPIYHRFLEESYARCDRVMMIHPARFLFQAGATPKKFIQERLADPHFKIVRYFANANDAFSGVDIKGGVAITYRDLNRVFAPVGTFIPFDELKGIFDKVTARADFKPLSEIMRGTCIFHFTEKLHAENPTARKKMSKGHDFDITTDAIENFPDIFLIDKPADGHDYIQIYGMLGKQRVFRWIRRDFVRDIPELHKYKVIIPAAYGGAGAIGENGPTMLVGLPLVGYTDSFIGVYNVRSEAEAAAGVKYIKTRFARALLGVLKATQHATPPKWRYVPQQDFSAASDVPWALPVEEIDEFLFEKYGLTAAERAFVLANVKAMV